MKFYYFDGRGIAEPQRWLWIFGGFDVEEVREPLPKFPPVIPPEIKSKLRWKTLPLLKVEGGSLNQSTAIGRYIAKKAKLVPEDDYEAALCDEYVDTLKEFMIGFFVVYDEQDPKKKEENLKRVVENSKSKYMGVLDSIIKANGGKHLVGNKVTWANILLACLMDHLVHRVNVDLTEDYPNVKAVKESIVNSPRIKAYLEKRAWTHF